ncbi:MAG: HAMP domain-containing protein [Planctomycetota bacterium]|nr:HAMP domain-containing protein [Planctomycetota bacterium]
MFYTSLRLRLILAFSAMVSLILFVGVVTYRINEDVRNDVAGLRASNFKDLRGQDLSQIGLEIEGYWNNNGTFMATKVTQEPIPRRPQLRGAIQSVASATRVIRIYGVDVQVVDATESADESGAKVDFNQLRVNARVELACRIDEQGRWIAVRIQQKNVKLSDKVKGTATGQSSDGETPAFIEIQGLKVMLEAQAERSPDSALARIDSGTQMMRVLQDCRTAAHAYVAATKRTDTLPTDTEPPINGPESKRVDDAAVSFQRILQSARSGNQKESAQSGDFQQQFEELEKLAKELDLHTDALKDARGEGLMAARAYLDERFEPFLDRLFKFVYMFLEKSNEELRDQLRDVQVHVDTTTEVALSTSAVAVALALMLGFLVWRSIMNPIRALQVAAVALGKGRLETRVLVSSRDEIGVLATAFNRMAGELASTTVSVKGLESMFESMAAGVIVCDQSGRITNTNRAAQLLVNRTPAELVGSMFETICRLPAAAFKVTTAVDSISAERTFVQRGGSDLPVSLSVAELRLADGQLQGHVFVAQDLTPIKRIEAQLRESLGEKEMLLREVHHRVKNNMQVISSLLAMQSAGADPQVLKRLEESQNRIRTIALIHEQLYQSTEVSKIDTRSYLSILSDHLLQSFGMADRVTIVQNVDKIDFDLDECLACGLIVNELLTNSMKYAFPNERSGTIRLSLYQLPNGVGILEVADDGAGIQDHDLSKPTHKTLGTSLIAKLARQLRGRVETDSVDGMTVRIVMTRSTAAKQVSV